MTSKCMIDLMPRETAVEAEGSWLRRFRYLPRPVKLTAVQWLIAQLVACGLSDKEIARMLEISAATVKAHHGKTMHALNFRRRTQLVRYVFESGQFQPEEAERMLAERKLRSFQLSAARMLRRERQEGIEIGGALANIS